MGPQMVALCKWSQFEDGHLLMISLKREFCSLAVGAAMGHFHPKAQTAKH